MNTYQIAYFSLVHKLLIFCPEPEDEEQTVTGYKTIARLLFVDIVFVLLRPVSRQIVRLQQIVCHCMILEVSTE